MIINSIHIKKFRGFEDIHFQLGTNLTAIAGQNGTQKTTLLGIISQPFTITDKTNPLFGEKPLCGGNYKSLFKEKFKLSDTFDKPKDHEWTLKLNTGKEHEFTIESIRRSTKKSGIRFWKKGDRSKGSGYLQIPVIYLSLSRLFPIGEDKSIDSSNEIILTQEEKDFYQDWHNDILIIPNADLQSVDYLQSNKKNTLGASTNYYDWKMNSAGQDNVGKILLAILSFKRLKEKFNDLYQGGILAIDELDATLYPGSQIKLCEALMKFSSKYNIQIVFTTHSLTILEHISELEQNTKRRGQVKIIYVEKSDKRVKTIPELQFVDIINKLKVALPSEENTIQIDVLTEDHETELFLKALLKGNRRGLRIINCQLGCDNFIELARKRVSGFRYGQSIIVLDGDVSTSSDKMKSINKLKHILVLPGKSSPERLLAEFLYQQSDESDIWESIQKGYSKQLTFRDYSLKKIKKEREDAKKWFTDQEKYWGRNCTRVINPWINDNQDAVNEFLENFKLAVNKLR